MIIIRKATLNDFESIYPFINELEETVFEREIQKNVFEAHVKNPANIYLIAEYDGNSVGFISCHSQKLLHHGGQNIGEIQEMYVSPTYRSMGIGKKLLDELKQVATQLGIQQLEVTSGKKRKGAHHFYMRENFMNTHEKFTLEL
ncbi:MAG: GNAT family N-acetyltransferase [Flavobacteriaceae bacterium]